jgi:hypothetical protein
VRSNHGEQPPPWYTSLSLGLVISLLYFLALSVLFDVSLLFIFLALRLFLTVFFLSHSAVFFFSLNYQAAGHPGDNYNGGRRGAMLLIPLSHQSKCRNTTLNLIAKIPVTPTIPTENGGAGQRIENCTTAHLATTTELA